jgi:hypothetical protein
MRIFGLLLFVVGVYTWTYQDENNWEGQCGESTDQSPINIDTDDTSEIDSDKKLKMVLLSKTTSSVV